MQLPLLGTLSALFGDAKDEFRKLLEPWALIAAAMFLGLGLGFFYLPLRPYLPGLRAWEEWTTAWQVIVASALLFALAYLINTLSGFFLALAGGRPLRDSPWVGRMLLGRQAARFERQRALALGQGEEASARAFQRLAYEFPARDELAPTALGNVRAAAAAYSQRQYGAHLDTVWPLVTLTLAKEDEELLGQLRGEQTATTFLATAALLLAVMAVLAMPLALAQGAWGRALAALALLLPAYGLYRAAIVRALGWGRLTRAALDLYLDDAGAKLGLRSLTGDAAATRARWLAVSKWLAYGGLPDLGDTRLKVPAAAADWYKEVEPPAPAKLTCAAGVAAEMRVVAGPKQTFPHAPAGVRLPATSYDVTILAAAAAPAGGATPTASPAAPVAGGFVMVSDKRLTLLPPLSGALHWPDGATTTVDALIVPGDDGDAYFWPLPALAAHGSGILRYAVAKETWLRAGPGVALEPVTAAASNAPDQLRVTLHYSGPSGGAATVTADPVTAESGGHKFQWAALTGGFPGPMTTTDVAYDAAARRATWTIPNATPGDYFLVLTLAGHGLK